MSWITECIKRTVEKSEAQPPEAAVRSEQTPSTFTVTWRQLVGVFERDTLEFNEARRGQYLFRDDGALIQVLAKQSPMDNAILEFDSQGGSVRVTCPIDHPGIPPRGRFKILASGGVLSAGDFVGKPQPPAEPITLERFSEFVLKPIFFPDLE